MLQDNQAKSGLSCVVLYTARTRIYVNQFKTKT